MDGPDTKPQLSLTSMANEQLHVDAFCRRPNFRCLITCDARYRTRKGDLLLKAQSADMVLDNAIEHLSGEGEKTLYLESGIFLFLPESGVMMTVTLFDELVFEPLTREDLDHLGQQSELYTGAPGGLDICSLIVRKKIKKVNGYRVEELERKFGNSWRWYLDSASKGFHPGVVALLGAVGNKPPGRHSIPPINRDILDQIIEVPSKLEVARRELWSNRAVIGQGVIDFLNQVAFLNILSSMKKDSRLGYWADDNPGDGTKHIYDASKHKEFFDL